MRAVEWEEAPFAGLPVAFFKSVFALASAPRVCFEWLAQRDSVVRPILFAGCALAPSLVLYTGLAMLFAWQTRPDVPVEALPLPFAAGFAVSALFGLTVIVGWPLTQWFVLITLGTPDVSLRKQLRLGAYALMPWFVVGWVPCIGWVVAMLWSTLLAVIGCVKGQRATAAEALLSAIAGPALVALLILGLRLDRFLLS